MTDKAFQRPVANSVEARLLEPPRWMQILAGPRQVGKTTLIRQLLEARVPKSYQWLAADPASLPPAPTLTAQHDNDAHAPPSTAWLQTQWLRAAEKARDWAASKHPQHERPFVLVIDEVQKVPQWSSHVKGLWDADRAHATPMHVVLLGSSPLLVQQGLVESLTGRYELLRMGHWSFEEMNDAFDFTLDQYIHFGGYPGSAPLVGDETRWRNYLRSAIVEPSIEKDVLEMKRVDKPALLRQMFELGCNYSGQQLALQDIRGKLGGHTNTLADYLLLLRQAGLLSGLHKYAAGLVTQRASPPKFQVHNNALMSVMSTYGFEQAQADRSHWGRKVESVVGTHLLNTADEDTALHYWRQSSKEVDFVVEHRGQLAAIEVKLAASTTEHAGLYEFCKRYPQAKHVLVGADSLPLGEFLRYPAAHWTA
jgi:uncharacterized protein